MQSINQITEDEKIISLLYKKIQVKAVPSPHGTPCEIGIIRCRLKPN